jgi:hypothetical protein
LVLHAGLIIIGLAQVYSQSRITSGPIR